MSKLVEFREIEQQLAELLRRQEALKDDDELKKDLQFADDLNALINEYGKTPAQVISIVAPELAVKKPAGKARRQRAIKVYVNPHNSERVETKGGNNKTLKEWKQQYGANVVESWVQAS